VRRVPAQGALRQGNGLSTASNNPLRALAQKWPTLKAGHKVLVVLLMVAVLLTGAAIIGSAYLVYWLESASARVPMEIVASPSTRSILAYHAEVEDPGVKAIRERFIQLIEQASSKKNGKLADSDAARLFAKLSAMNLKRSLERVWPVEATFAFDRSGSWTGAIDLAAGRGALSIMETVLSRQGTLLKDGKRSEHRGFDVYTFPKVAFTRSGSSVLIGSDEAGVEAMIDRWKDGGYQPGLEGGLASLSTRLRASSDFHGAFKGHETIARALGTRVRIGCGADPSCRFAPTIGLDGVVTSGFSLDLASVDRGELSAIFSCATATAAERARAEIEAALPLLTAAAKGWALDARVETRIDGTEVRADAHLDHIARMLDQWISGWKTTAKAESKPD
jgi:hypothetical protein